MAQKDSKELLHQGLPTHPSSATAEAPAPSEELEESSFGEAQRIAALKAEKDALRGTDTVNEKAIQDILDAPSIYKPKEPEAPKPSLLEWAQAQEAKGNIAEKVQAEINSQHAEIGATGRLAELVSKDNDVLVENFKLDERQQQLHTDQTGERPSHNERVVHGMEKAALYKEPQRADVQEQVRAAFKVFDKDGDGKISLEEFRNALMHPKGGSPVSQEKADEYFAAADKDGNGIVDYEEFVIAFTQKRLRPPGWVNPDSAQPAA